MKTKFKKGDKCVMVRSDLTLRVGDKITLSGNLEKSPLTSEWWVDCVRQDGKNDRVATRDIELACKIYDTNKKQLFGSRDRFGVKPFYYFKDANQFLFASEQKALRKKLEEATERLNRGADVEKDRDKLKGELKVKTAECELLNSMSDVVKAVAKEAREEIEIQDERLNNNIGVIWELNDKIGGLEDTIDEMKEKHSKEISILINKL